MLLPTAFYPLHDQIQRHLSHLRPAQMIGLALWVGATVMARSSCQNAVLGALLSLGLGWHTTRQYLREWLYDGSDRAAPCGVQLDVQACFAPLLRWVLAWWQGSELTLAVDPTAKGGALVALVVSVVYRGLAIPVAWCLKPGGQPGPLIRVGKASIRIFVRRWSYPEGGSIHSSSPGGSGPGRGCSQTRVQP